MSILRSIFGIFTILFLGYLLSYDRKNIKWKTIIAGFALQFCFAFLVMKTSGGAYVLESVSNGFNKIIAQANEGIQFVFGGLYSPGTNIAFVFAFNVLPLIIFFGALISVLYHLGIMQLVIKYIGGGISKLLVSRSQLFAVLTCGVASVSGSTLAAYAALGVPMKYLIAGSFMAAPSGLVFAKLIMPETQADSEDEKIEFTKSDSVNVIEAAAKGTIDGMNIALVIGAILISFIALVSLVNMILGGIGDLFGIQLTLQIILGYIFAPITYAMGIPWHEAIYTGSLLGQKMVLNEFVAYVDFTKNITELSEKTIAIMSFALLGFANVASLGLQIGALGALAPNRRSEIAQVGMRAVLAGFLASLLNGVIAGAFF